LSGIYIRSIQSKKIIGFINGLDPSEEYFRRKENCNNEDTYFPPEESEPPQNYKHKQNRTFKTNCREI
tara:strand:- start:117 stop:320 length:204 start_codon:yes stop_codon:yes gene_type:complete